MSDIIISKVRCQVFKVVYTLLFLLIGFYSQAQMWEYAPLANQAQRDAGLIGGEGGQWPQALAIDNNEGNIMLFGSDVGGIWKSVNGGALWEPANNGFIPRGTCGIFIDPNNPARTLVVGSNSSKAIWNNYHGLYLTTDTAKTWHQVLLDNASGYRDIREQIAFDPSSYDPTNGYTAVVYYSRIAVTASSEGGTGTLAGGLYKSVDGGSTWNAIPNSTDYAGSIVKVHPTKGYLYVANSKGFFKSTDQGQTFVKTSSENIKGMDVCGLDSSKVFICSTNKIYISSDEGNTFTQKTASGFTSYANYLRVSPVDTLYMITQHSNPSDPWNTYYLYTHNGGATWSKTADDKSLDYLPRNLGRLMYPSWHPSNKEVLFAVGGDFITKSSNGGQSLVYSNNGSSAIMSYGNFSFNLDNPDLIFFAAQDYDASVSLNGGYTYKYLNITGNGWGGDVHGGYIVDSLTWFGRKAEGWDDKPTELRITFNGGQSYQVKGTSAGLSFCYGVPGDRNVLFAGDLRSTDKGVSWTKMIGCDGVITSDPKNNHDLYGVFNNTMIVRSVDKGANWQAIAGLSGKIYDLAYDHISDALYAACYDAGLFKIYVADSSVIDITSKTPGDIYNVKRFSTVAVDPTNPEIVYSGDARNIYSNDVGVIRSTDGGETWIPLTIDPRHNNSQFGMSSGRETTMIRVNPKDKKAYCSSSCYGFWKIAQPDTIPPPSPKFRLNQSQINLKIGESFQLIPRFNYTSDTAVSWKSSNSSKVSIDTNGLVKALATGSAVITATTNINGMKATCKVVVPKPKAPYGGIVRLIPGKIEAEEYDEGGEGVAYNDLTVANQGGAFRTTEGVDIENCSEGGFDVGWIDLGEWLSYTVNVDSTMYYDVEIRAAVNSAAKINVTFSNGNATTGDINMAATGGWTSWKTFTLKDIFLNKSEQEMRINMTTSGFNLNYIKLNRSSTIGNKEIPVLSNFKIYPNPITQGNIHIASNNSYGLLQVYLYTVQGELLYKFKTMDEKGIQIDRSSLASGVYLLKVSNSVHTETIKLVVQ